MAESPKREWVVGFLLDDEAERVVLIRKNRPEWQTGKLNGVGGKVELHDHTLSDAMRREFLEETGADVAAWERYACLNWEEGIVHFYRSFAPLSVLQSCRTMTDERVVQVSVLCLLKPHWRNVVTPNLRWLVPLAAHRHDAYDVIDVVETGTTLRKPGRSGVL